MSTTPFDLKVRTNEAQDYKRRESIWIEMFSLAQVISQMRKKMDWEDLPTLMAWVFGKSEYFVPYMEHLGKLIPSSGIRVK